VGCTKEKRPLLRAFFQTSADPAASDALQRCYFVPQGLIAALSWL
jgi:hypothetical protein